MNPALYLGLSLVAVALVVTLSWALGFRTDRRLGSAEEARTLLEREFPDARGADIHLSADGASAVAVDERCIYLVVCIADGASVRRFARSGMRIRALEAQEAPGLRLDVGEVATPPITVRTQTVEAGRELAARIAAACP